MSRPRTPANRRGPDDTPFQAPTAQANFFTVPSTDCSRPARNTAIRSHDPSDANGHIGMETEMLAGVLDHAEWIVFALILANQAGVPVFAAPALLAVGALAWTGDVNVGVVLAGATGASLCADFGWYTVGRWRGHRALAALGRRSRGTRAFVDDAQRIFLAHDRAFQLGARFLPELNPVAAALAGVAGVGLRRFVLGATLSAAIWAGAWIGVGYLIASATWSGGGSGIPFFSVIVAASALASLTVAIRPAARGITLVVRSLGAKDRKSVVYGKRGEAGGR